MKEKKNKETSLKNGRVPKYLVFLLLGLVIGTIGTGLYAWSNLTTYYNIPKGALDFSFGPRNNVTLVETKMFVSVSAPQDIVDLQVSFNFSEYQEYFINMVMPYETFQARPYLIYQHEVYFNETSKLGNISSNFKSFPTMKSSVINATFIPNEDFFFFPNEPITLSVEARVSGLTSISHPLGSRQTVILTFFGDQTGVWDDEMRPYIGANPFSMLDYPLRVFVRFPRDSYLSDTFPTPIELFVTERFRTTIFDLDFSYPSGYAQSISCSFVSPQSQSSRDLLTFLSGILLATGITLCIESIRTKKNEGERKVEVKKEIRRMKQEEKQRDVTAGEETKEDEILKLIQLVDRSYRSTAFDFFFRGSNVLAFVAFIEFFVLIGLFLFFAPSLYEQIVVATSFSAFGIAFFSLMSRFFEEHIVEVNFKRFSNRVGKNKRPLLKALIKMKAKNHEIALEQIYNLDKTMFSKEKLLKRLYE